MKNKQGITIAALIIAIVGLSIGFAAFSNTLTISSSASVTPDPTSMNVVFSSSSSSAQYNSITPTKNLDNVTNFTATNATITGADYRTLNNVSAAFTEPGQNVTYNLYVYNAGSYKAYLNELSMGTKSCSIVENQEHPEQEATESLKNAACEGISISVSIDNVTLTSSGSLNNMELDVDSSKPVQIVISYASNASFVDGPISVSFGNITFNATSAPKSSGGQGGNEPTPSEPQEETCTVTNVKSFGNTCTLSQDNDSSGTVTKGDKVTCGTESFYVIENPSNGTTKMLAEWNLNISDGIIDEEMGIAYSYTYCESTPGYQDSHVRGYLDYDKENPDPSIVANMKHLVIEMGGETMEGYMGYGIVPFDSATTGVTGYWTTGDNQDLNTSVYTQNNNGSYPAYVYDNNATLKTFVDAYVGYLNSQVSGANAQGRLINTSELEALGCSMNDYICSDSPATVPVWVYQTSYWSGSAGGNDCVWYVSSGGGFRRSNFDSYGYYGVRPVIEISSSVIQTS